MRIINNLIHPNFITLPCYAILWGWIAGTGLALAQETQLSARELVNSMSNASRTLNYDGVFIYRRGQQMDTLRLIHKVGKDGETERLVSLTGHPREVIRNNRSVTCIFPDNQAIMVEKSRSQKLFSPQLPGPVEKFSKHYTISYTGDDRVAGKQTKIVSIQPKDTYRYGYRLWIGTGHHLLLKSELRNNAGHALEQIIFTHLDVLDDIPDEKLKPSISGKGYKWYDSSNAAPETASMTKKGNWQVKWMPTGFTMSNYEKQPIVTSNDPVDHMVYTDGLAMVSVFVEKMKKRSQFIPGPSKMGAVNAYVRSAGGYRITAVGEVPQATVHKMAISVSTGQ